MGRPRKRRSEGKLPKINGKHVRSQFEFVGYKQLRNVTPKRTIIQYEVDKLPYIIEAEYIPDFSIRKSLSDPSPIYIEMKGRFTFEDRRKILAVKKNNPHIDLRIVFQSNHPGALRKNGKVRPSDWAEKYGFPYAVKEIPKEWFEEKER